LGNPACLFCSSKCNCCATRAMNLAGIADRFLRRREQGRAKAFSAEGHDMKTSRYVSWKRLQQEIAKRTRTQPQRPGAWDRGRWASSNRDTPKRAMEEGY
jgi:hypothetical protein